MKIMLNNVTVSYEICRQKGIKKQNTTRYLAEFLNVDRSAITEWYRGNRQIPVGKLYEISIFLKIPMGKLIIPIDK